MSNDDPESQIRLNPQSEGDVGATRVISIAEQQVLEQAWEKTVDKNLELTADISGGTAGEKLEVDSVDTPEFRARLNDVNRRYKFVSEYTEGGFGIISKARDRTLDREVIIKSLRKEFIQDRTAAKKFIAEAKLHAQLDHPSIAPLYSLDTDHNQGLHLAMKFIDGITLKDYIVRLKVKYNLNTISQADERRSLRHRLEYFIKICQAIEYSHSRDIVHCDLKPDNIMIGAYGEVYVMDWGTAAHPGKRRRGAVEGTPAYLAPETLIDGTVDPLSDIFSLGLILFELMTLKRAVEGQTVNEIIGKIRAGNFEPMTHYLPRLRIQPSLKAIVAKAAHLNQNHRYQSVSDLADDVRRFMFHEEVSARPDSVLQRVARRMYNNRVKTFAFLSLLILGLASIAVLGFYRETVGTQKASEKILRHIKFQIATDQQGSAIDRYFLSAQDLLQTYASNVTLVLENPPRDLYQGKVYSLADFRNPAAAPADYTYSPAYRSRISLDFPVYFTIVGASAKNPPVGMETLRSLYQLRGVAHSLLLQSDPSLNVTGAPALHSFDERLIQSGAPLRRFFVIVNDQIMLNYPGSGEIDETRSPHDWGWYQTTLKTKKTTWGAFYQDSSGNLLLPCATPLVSTNGEILGVAGMDISFDYVTNKLMAAGRDELSGTEKYLVNEEGKVVAGSSLERNSNYITGATPKRRELAPFPYWQVMEKMLREGSDHQRIVNIKGRRMLFSYSSVSSLGWYFIQITDFDRLMDLSHKLSGPGEKLTRDQFKRYREENQPMRKLIDKIRPQTPNKEDETVPAPVEETVQPPAPAAK